MARVHRGEVTLFDTGTAVHVMDVWAASPDEAWAVTQNNVLIHVLDGEVTTRSISRGSGSAGLVIGHEGEVVAGAGRLQLVQTAGPSGHIGPGNNLSPRDGQVVGDDLLVLSTRALERWDGVAWTRTDVPPHALTFTVADDGTYVSGKGELWRTQGNEVTVVETPLAKDICPLPTGGVMLVGDGLRTWTP
jgi:hypothetical protein